MLCSYNLRPANYSYLNWKMVEPNEDGTIYWHIVNFTPDQPKHKTLYAFNKAFEIWQEAFDKVPPVGRYIKLKPTSDFHEAHVRIFFMNTGVRTQKYTISDGSTYELVNNWPFDGEQGVLAHRPPNKHELHFDEAEQWSDIHKFEKQGGKWRLFVNLMAVVLHELGHIWDLNHSAIPKALMYGAYRGDVTSLHADDLNGFIRKWAPVKARIAAKIKSAAPLIQEFDSSDLLLHAFQFYGMKEVPGDDSNQQILSMIKEVFPYVSDDSKVAWCSIFMNSVAKMAGYDHSNSAMAKSWLKVGKQVEFDDRRIGDVVVFHRTRDPRFGHVGIYINDREGERVRVLGGNQQNAVNIRSYPTERIAGFRRLSKIT